MPTDVDRFISTNQATWARLEELVRRAGRAPERLAGAELDELVRLHLRVSSHLSTVRTHLADPQLAAHLTALVARSTAVVHGSRPRTLAGLLRATTETFPAAVWHVRWATLAAAAVFLVTATAVAAWLAVTPAAVQLAIPDEAREAFLTEDFVGYYSAEAAPGFAARVFTNNAAVAAMAFGSGVAFAIPTVLILVLNGVNVGVAAGLFHAAGDPGTFWWFVLPHGLLELTAVFVAAGAGLHLGWAVIAPGDRSRLDALAEEGRRAVVIVVGLVLVFALAGLVEAFVTPAPWPTWARVGTGAAVWLAVGAAVTVAGRRGARRGLTGAPGERPRDPSGREPRAVPASSLDAATGPRTRPTAAPRP